MPHAVITGTTPHYAHQDGLGNVLALTAGVSSLSRDYTYDDWGTLTQGTDYAGLGGADRSRWKGALWAGPEADLYYMRNRWYEPRTGRFLSEDPIGLEGGLNPYVFGLADPVNHRDPEGTQCFTITPYYYDRDTNEILRVLPSYLWCPGGGGSGGGGVDGGGGAGSGGQGLAGNDKDCKAETINFVQNAAIDVASALTGGIGGFAIRRGSRLLNRVSRAQFGAGHVGLSQLSAIRGESLMHGGEGLRGVAGAMAFGGFAWDFHSNDLLGMLGGSIDFALSALVDIVPGAGTLIAAAQLASCKLSK